MPRPFFDLRASLRASSTAALLWVSTGCAAYTAPLDTEPPLPGTLTRTNEKLTSLPAPQEPIAAAVYRFRDQTGQYKPSDIGTSWSTAVTQGATSILTRAMEESGWFIPIEREGLSNLLAERQIIQSIRSQYEGPEGERLGPLPPLLYAGVLLEGGIIGYDTNLHTSGYGLRYFGAGGSGQIREDQVTVYLRAVSTQTGRVLKTVHTTKTVLSQRTDAGLFRFVDVDRLLETEIGYSVNEPLVVAVTEAIEESVRSLIIEGIRENLWALQDPADRAHPALQDYDRTVTRARELDPWGNRGTTDRTGFSLAVSGGARRYQGNYREPLTRPAGEVALRWFPSTRFGLGVAGSVGDIGATSSFERSAVSVEGQVLFFLTPRAAVSPFFRMGGGVMRLDSEEDFFFASGGGGVEYMVGPSAALTLALWNQYALEDDLDGVVDGKWNDSVWNLTFGVAWYR